MLCQKCQQRPATVFFTQTAGGKTTQAHLCETCAREQMKAQGVVNPFSLNPFAAMADFFNNFMAGSNIQEVQAGRTPVPVVDPSIQCPYCGYQLSTFRQNGRLGCTRCYEAFAGFLQPFVASIHGNVHHTEEAPEKPATVPLSPQTGDDSTEVSALREKLKMAVQNEKFEDAAAIRDQIQKLKEPPRV
jgi:protein arginine kinase activator